MRVLVIPEDFRKDQYILDPVIRAMFSHLDKPTARIVVCRDPLLGGVGEALKWERLGEIVERYPMIDLFLLVVDRDGVPGRRAALDRLEECARNVLPEDRLFLGECAWQELEVWVLAGHDLRAAWVWADIQAEPHSKEVYFEPFARERGVADAPAGGRKALAEEAATRYTRIRLFCPELRSLESRTSDFLGRA
jgi:hypothetical protein